MSAREALPREAMEMLRVDEALDSRAMRMLTDGFRHNAAALSWALSRNVHMACFTASELALGAYQVHRT